MPSRSPTRDGPCPHRSETQAREDPLNHHPLRVRAGAPAARGTAGRRRARTAARLLPVLALFVLSSCGGKKADPYAPAPSVAPIGLGGQKVLIVPLQATNGLTASRADLTAEVVFALTEREGDVTWLKPDDLRRSLRRSPGYAGDPSMLPQDLWLHHGQRRIVDPLAGVLRRYSALMDVRLVLVPREARWVPGPTGAAGTVRLSAAVVDTRSGMLVWWGEADGDPRPAPDAAAVASAASALAARVVAGTGSP